jgi:hypothetical protein
VAMQVQHQTTLPTVVAPLVALHRHRLWKAFGHRSRGLSALQAFYLVKIWQVRYVNKIIVLSLHNCRYIN